MRRRQFGKQLAAATVLCLGRPALAADYPTRTIRIVDAYPAGGSTDFLARHIAAQTGNDWGVSVVVENRGGAAGQIGTGSVARGEPDGYTLLIIPNELWSVTPVLFKNLPYDTYRQLKPVAPVAQVPVVMAVHPSLPVSTVKELIAYAKRHPRQVTYGSAGPGSIHHLAGEMFATMTGVQLMHIPYKGSAPAVTDLAGGQISLVFSPITALLPHVKAGKLKALAVAGGKRALALPEVPTIAESGVPGYETTLRVSLLAPSGTPDGIVEKWFQQTRHVMTGAEMSEALAAQGMEPDVLPYADWRRRLDQEAAQWKHVIDVAGIRID